MTAPAVARILLLALAPLSVTANFVTAAAMASASRRTDQGSASTRFERVRALCGQLESEVASEREQARDELEVIVTECQGFALDPALHDIDAEDARRAFAAGAAQLAAFQPVDAALLRLETAARAGDLLASADDSMAEADADVRGGIALPRVRLLVHLGRVAEALWIADSALLRDPDAPLYAPILGAEQATLRRSGGDYVGALAALDAAEARLKDGDPSGDWSFHSITRCEIAGERAQVFLDLGRADLAASHAKVESDLAPLTGDPTTRFSAALHQVHLALAREDYPGALARIDATQRDAALIAAVSPAAVAALEVRAAQALGRMAIDDPSRLPEARERARSAPRELLNAEDAVIVELVAARAELQSGDAAAAKSRLDAARSAIAAGGGEPPAMLAAQIAAAQAGYALAFAGSRATSGAAPDELSEGSARELRAAVEDVLAAWDRAPALPSGLGFFHFASRCELVAQAIRVESAIGDDGDARGFDLLLAVGARSRLGGGEVTTLAELRAALVPGEAIFAWLPSPERTHLFVLTERTLERFETVGLTPLRAAGAALEDDLDAGRAIDASGHRLFSLLFPPAARPALAVARHVTLNGLEVIGMGAVEACIMDDGRSLGVAKAVTRAPSLPWLARRAKVESSVRERGLVLVAAPEHSSAVLRQHSELAPLSPADARVDDFLAIDPRAEVLQGPRASLERVRNALALPPAVLLFFTHGVLDPSDPRPGRLVVAAGEEGGSGLVTCADAEALPAADLVILAACRAGVGPLRRGDAGASDLAGAFLFAGAGAVVSPSGDVRAGPAARLMLDFYRSLREGVRPSQALAEARRRRIESAAGGGRPEDVRVAFRFRIDGLGHRPLTFGAAASSGLAPSDPSAGSRGWRMASVVAAAIALLCVFVGRARRRGVAMRKSGGGSPRVRS